MDVLHHVRQDLALSQTLPCLWAVVPTVGPGVDSENFDRVVLPQFLPRFSVLSILHVGISWLPNLLIRNFVKEVKDYLFCYN